MNWYTYKESWSFILRRYLPRLALCSLAWEILQLPLYTLWSEPSLWWIAYAVAHCTVGDAMIGTAALIVALTLTRANETACWPRSKIAVRMILLALAYTVFSERSNLALGNWAYSPWMPIVPWINVGLAPLLQWLLVPLAAWRWANRLSFSATKPK
ncbi:MAG: hypothetical protein HYZ65_12415 [Burkholderiales bacterium]|nr:hypothetical protein [Burkholderiales bacterium]